MGNPAIHPEDGGACTSCEHFKGLRTEPQGVAWTLCGQGMSTFRFLSLPPDKGCRYWTEIEPVIPHESG
jgi:hypothetical protein